MLLITEMCISDKMSMQRKVIIKFLSIVEFLGYYNRFGAVLYPVFMFALTSAPSIYLMIGQKNIPGNS